MSKESDSPKEPTLVTRDEATVPPPVPASETTLADVKQYGLWAAIASLSYVFWVVGGMEMVERLAYYGVRVVATLYVTRPADTGALGRDMVAYGTLLFWWNMTQTWVPVFTGGLSDRYGYKQTIFVATAVKAFGYLVMAWLHSYAGFFAGAMLLAIGTAIFKPGLQGTLVRASNRRNSSMAWGIFYQTVNIGGWIGPLIALRMRSESWNRVFYTNAAVICCNFLLLLTYREPGKEERLARRQRIREGKEKQHNLALESLKELTKPVLWVYMVIFSVWWFMFPMMWDVLPKYIDDWVDTRPMVHFLFGADGTRSAVWKFLLGMNEAGNYIEPEGIVQINSGMIMLTCFLFAGLSARMRATTSLLVGTILLVTALVMLGAGTMVGTIVAAMIVFSAGEMLASPKFSEYLGNIAPMDKKAMWMGFSQVPILVGWTIEGKMGPLFYHFFSDKDKLARDALEGLGMAHSQVSEAVLPVGKAVQRLMELTGKSSDQVTQMLYQQHHVGLTWFIFAAVGVAAGVMIYFYGRWIKRMAA